MKESIKIHTPTKGVYLNILQNGIGSFMTKIQGIVMSKTYGRLIFYRPLANLNTQLPQKGDDMNIDLCIAVHHIGHFIERKAL